MTLTDTQKSIIKSIFVKKESSRSILANQLSLTHAGLTLALKPLLSEKMVLESPKKQPSKVGRRELALILNPDYGFLLGVDIKKDHCYYVVTDFAGNLIAHACSSDISFDGFFSPFYAKAIALGVTLKGSYLEKEITERYAVFFSILREHGIPYFFFNNVDCLADIYSLYHPDEKNFLLVKYGPGVGSSIYVNSKPIGHHSELGHVFYQGKTIENTISYSALLGKETEEEEGVRLLLKDKEKLNTSMSVLATLLYNADCILSLQKIILSGTLLSFPEVKNMLKQEILEIFPSFDTEKLIGYSDYSDLSIKKAAFGSFIRYFRQK